MPPLLATYRLQLHNEFNLQSAENVLEYLSQLGISHVYTSPLTRARGGSKHGYDVVDPSALNPELGTPADFQRFVASLHSRSMAHLLDIVPNHMATGAENPRWEDVLTHGPSSRYARWFDVDWRSRDPELRGRILVPVLGDLRHRVLARGELKLYLHHGQIRVCYHDHSFPTDPATWPIVFQFLAWQGWATDGEVVSQFSAALRRIPARHAADPSASERRRLAASDAVGRMRDLAETVPDFAAAMEGTLTEFSAGEAGMQRMTRFLDLQAYRLAYWRRAAREINYRRFFDINDLIAVRVDREEVFADTHSLIFDWVARGMVSALRIDHIDGLADPLAYLVRLARRVGPDVPIFVEKILAAGEDLRREWPVAGTTGYEFLNQVESTLVDPRGVERLEAECRRRILQRDIGFAETARRSKRTALKAEFSAAVGRLARQWLALEEADRVEHEDFVRQASPAARARTAAGSINSPTATPRQTNGAYSTDAWPGPMQPLIDIADAVHALTEFIAALGVYRTYIDRYPGRAWATPDGPRGDAAALRRRLEPEDRALIDAAMDKVKSAPAPPAAIDRLAAILRLDDVERLSAAAVERRLKLIARLQQVSSPAAAKGVEDTAFYSWVPLLSRNEVGGDPAEPPYRAVMDLHDACQRRAERHPHCLLTVTTHDTKRSADVRARLDVLSEIPDEWLRARRMWTRRNRRYRQKVAGQYAPDLNTEYLLYQTLVGAWPLPESGEESGELPGPEFRQRIEEYMVKAAREAKVQTRWSDPDAAFEKALVDFIRALLPDRGRSDFAAEVQSFVARIARPGLWNSLSRTLIQLTSPGTPDTYQGDELWNFTLVDPDNRRSVDFDLRSRLLVAIQQAWNAGGNRAHMLADWLRTAEDGRIKLHVIHRGLQARRRHAELFLRGGYEPLIVEGPKAEHVIAFARHCPSELGITIVPRMTLRLLASTLANGEQAPSMAQASAPLGDVWSSTEVIVPDWIAEIVDSLRSEMTDELIAWPAATGRKSLRVAEVLGHFPVALLIGRNESSL